MSKKKKKELESTFVMSECIVEHKYDGEIKFNIVHNLPDVPGLCIEDALVNWSARTSEITAESFCEYVNSKNTGFVCITEDRYNKMLKENENN